MSCRYTKKQATDIDSNFFICIIFDPVESKNRFLQMTFEKLAKLTGCKETDKRVAVGFNSRQNERDKAYSVKARNQAPTDKFFSRSYNL